MGRIVDSRLIEASIYPSAIQCPKLVLKCMNKYDPEPRCIKNVNGGVLLNANWEIVVDVFKIPTKETYEDWTITTSYGFFSKKKTKYRSVIARN